MSDKVRIHDLAKKYGMPGKDLAAKLRDFGFGQAKSHMSALDPFEVLQAEGLLEANGISPSESAESAAEAAGPLGGLKIKRKKKSAARSDEGDGGSAEGEPADGAEEGAHGEEAAAPVAETAPEPGPEPQAVSSAGGGGPSAELEGAPPPSAGPPRAGSGAATEPPPEQAPPGGRRAHDEVVPHPRPAATRAGQPAAAAAAHPPEAEVRSGEPSTVSPAPEAGPSPAPAVEATPEARGAERPAAARTSAPEAPSPVGPEGPGAPVAEAGPRRAPEAADHVAPSGTAKAAKHGKAKHAEDLGADKKAAGPRGTVVGFIDLSNVQRPEPKRKTTESRRIQSRDEATPDVRPTYGRGKAAGPRGKLTAAELREREQGRFLRRGGRATTPTTGGPGTGVAAGRRGPGGRPQSDVKDSPLAGTQVAVEAPVTMSKLAEALKLKANVVIKKAMEEKFGLFNLNSLLDDDTAALIAHEFEVELQVLHEMSAEQTHLEGVKKKRSEIEEAELVERPPTVAFLGHVDHGKTTLIDKIRSSAVAEHESGGITQHIGAYQVTTAKGHKVTIIDTPGHEAFTAMRARGARAVDIVVLVVAGDDGVKPSTVEALNHAKVAGTPVVVALNKADKPEFNANAVIQQLMGHELIPEQYGGKTAMFQTSGTTGQGIEELLEHIFLMGELELALKAHPTGPAAGVVLEAEIQQGRGIVAHLLVQDGTLIRGDIILAGEGYGKVKSIHDDRGRQIDAASPSMPVEVTGLAALPGVGDTFHVIEDLATAKEIATERERNNRAVALAGSRDSRRELEAILGSSPKAEHKMINLIVRADVQGSAEVIAHEVAKLKHEEVEVKLIHYGVGPITESDVNLAASSAALLVAFHVGVNGKARQEADRHGLDIRRYEVIYELLDDLRNLMEGALSPEFKEEVLGHTEIRRIFKSSKLGLIAGCFVLDGKLTRNSRIRLLRDGVVVHTGEIASLKREKEDTREVREGFECGVVLKDYRDIHEGDVLESFVLKEVKRTLEGGR